MPFLHPNARLEVSTLDGWSDFVLLQPLPFRTRGGRLLRCRAGASTDGLTGPKFAKCDLQSTNSFFPAVAHDGWYRGDLEESFDGGLTWQPMKYPEDDALAKMQGDLLLRELCEDNGVPEAEATLIYEAVAEFGKAAWESDRALRTANKQAPRPYVGTLDGGGRQTAATDNG